MEIKLKLNGKQIVDLIEPDMLLLDFCRKHHCKSVKRGCETSNAVYVRYGWTARRCSAAMYWQRVLLDTK